MAEALLYYSQENEVLEEIERYLETFNLDYKKVKEESTLPKLEIDSGESREIYLGLEDLKNRFPELDAEKLPRKF